MCDGWRSGECVKGSGECVMGSGEYALPTVQLLWTTSTCTTCWRSGECALLPIRRTHSSEWLHVEHV